MVMPQALQYTITILQYQISTQLMKVKATSVNVITYCPKSSFRPKSFLLTKKQWIIRQLQSRDMKIQWKQFPEQKSADFFFKSKLREYRLKSTRQKYIEGYKNMLKLKPIDLLSSRYWNMNFIASKPKLQPIPKTLDMNFSIRQNSLGLHKIKYSLSAQDNTYFQQAIQKKITPYVTEPNLSLQSVCFGLMNCYLHKVQNVNIFAKSAALQVFKVQKLNDVPYKMIKLWIESRVLGRQFNCIRYNGKALNFQQIGDYEEQ